jgi:hypothetical protein
MKTIVAAACALTAAFAATAAVHAEGGCGAGWHRGPWGGCRRNAVIVAAPVVVAPAPVVVAAPTVVYAPAGRACPYGYHLGPMGRRCWPN